MLIENTSREWIVAMPPTAEGGQPTEIARIVASETNKVLTLKFAKGYGLKELRTGFNFPPAFARNLGDALIKAADLASEAWKE
jgi:hypothetical protein